MLITQLVHLYSTFPLHSIEILWSSSILGSCLRISISWFAKISTTTYLKLVHIAAAFYIWQQQQSAIKISGPWRLQDYEKRRWRSQGGRGSLPGGLNFFSKLLFTCAIKNCIFLVVKNWTCIGCGVTPPVKIFTRFQTFRAKRKSKGRA